MTERERLVELIGSKVCEDYSLNCDEQQPHFCGKCYANDCRIEELADYLLANGVLCTPVKIGQELWDIHYNKPRKWEVYYICYNGEEWFINLKYFKNKNDFATRQIESRYLNRLYFLTKEEAEKALDVRKEAQN